VRIAFVDTTLETSPTGGCQTFLVDVTRALHASGQEVHVVYQSDRDRTISERLAAAGVAVHRNPWSPWSTPEERAASVVRWVQDRRIDVFVVSLSPDVGWLALPLLDANVTTVAIVHSDGPSFYRPLAHYAPFVDCAVGVSARTHQRIIEECGIPPERARHIPYGVHRARASEVSKRWEIAGRPGFLRLAYLGRLEHSQKRVRDLPGVLSALASRGVPFEVEVIGDGEEAGWLRREVNAAGLASRVSFQGWLTPADVRRRLLTLDVLLLLSVAEGLPLALLEAMGHAVVPVVTNIASGNTEVVRDGENGYLVPVGDVNGFADRLQSLAGDPHTLCRLRRAAWQTSRLYSVERMVSSYVEVFNAHSSSSGRAPRPPGSYPLMPSCRSRYPLWVRRLKWGVLGGRRLPLT
jgi:glycosyltransferase involved in cell wall biosynthesis